MKIVTNKITALLAIVLLTFSTITLLITPLTQAQTTYENMENGGSYIDIPAGVTPDVTISTHAYLSFTPNPIGVGQPLLVNVWITPPTHVSRYFAGLTVTITKPDGTQIPITPIDTYRGDATSWFEYPVDQAGEWTLKLDFPGAYFPAGNYTTHQGAVFALSADQVSSFTETCYYEPSSTEEQTLIVQEDIVYSWPPAELPTDYWTRPVTGEHREWWPILGNYPGTGYPGSSNALWDELYPNTNTQWSDRYNFHPWVQSSTTAHIVWRRQDAIAGIIGGPVGQLGTLASPSTPSLIYSGRAYDTYVDPESGVTLWRCYDLRTGEVFWEKPAATTTSTFFGQVRVSSLTPNILAYTQSYATLAGMPAVPGATAGAGYAVELIAITGGYLVKWDPWSGAITTNVSISPLTGTGGTYYKNECVLAVQNLGGGEYRLINWTTAGTTSDFSQRVLSNTTYAMSSLPTLVDYNAGYGASVSSVTPQNSIGVAIQMTVTGYDLYTGEQLWTNTFDERQYSGSTMVADHGKVAVLTMDGYFLAYDLATGTQVWKSETMAYPWGESSFGAYEIQSAYGMIFRESYDAIYAFNWDDGTIAWTFESPTLAAFETPYVNAEGGSVNPFAICAGSSITKIADGMLYTYNNEHSPSYPTTRGWSLYAINVTNGECVWKILGQMAPGGMADGYLTAGNANDGYMYVFGMGKSATTVTAPDVGISVGTPFMIRGSVLDLSPAQPNTPCVSKDSMSTQMEYLHMQMPIGGLWGDQVIIGVPVTLTAVSESGEYINIGTTTTNGYYGNFGIEWTAPAEGTYEIIASFAGDESYGSSGAATKIVVGPAASASTPIEPEPETPTPEEPTTPETPETPEEPETPETSETPKEPEPEPTTEAPLVSTELAIVITVISVVAIGAVAYLVLVKRK